MIPVLSIFLSPNQTRTKLTYLSLSFLSPPRDATFYGGGGTGACGSPNDDSLSTVALFGVPDGSPKGAYNDGVNCGKTITIKRIDTGVVATANITNACPSCGNSNNIDLSDSLFKEKLGGTAELGIMKVEWSCEDCVF
ncbi:hypothetical protein IAR55_000834 [Kwoniella newhampshirensis]|uniref:Barwin domain-containing protein n=1 Tax=Kwoniella newhampshirensis TaxID=1651941 RepID=A0AAW0Z409_9TREE